MKSARKSSNSRNASLEAIARITAARKKYEFVHSNNGFGPQVPENVDAVKGAGARRGWVTWRNLATSCNRWRRNSSDSQRACEINRVAESLLTHYRDRATDFADVLSENLNVPGATYYKAQVPMNQVQDALNAGRAGRN